MFGKGKKIGKIGNYFLYDEGDYRLYSSLCIPPVNYRVNKKTGKMQRRSGDPLHGHDWEDSKMSEREFVSGIKKRERLRKRAEIKGFFRDLFG